jgi:ABC-2 type transport system ATP-binding protein
MLSINAISKSYAEKVAVRNLSLEVSGGEIFGILGPNGAGKTSTIRMICGITLPDSGTIELLGSPITDARQNRIGYLPEERGLYKKMKVQDILIYLAELKGLSKSDAKTRAAHWLNRFEISSWATKKVEELSKGMQQKIQFIAVVLHDPDLLILDEPFSGLDPINSELITTVILELKQAGKTILFSTHRMEQIEKLCDSICLINNGEKVLDGNVRQIKKSYSKNYLQIDFEGNPNFITKLTTLALAQIIEQSPKSIELKLLGAAKPKDILQLIDADTEITRLELVEPSLKEIFILRVAETSNQTPITKPQ